MSRKTIGVPRHRVPRPCVCRALLTVFWAGGAALLLLSAGPIFAAEAQPFTLPFEALDETRPNGISWGINNHEVARLFNAERDRLGGSFDQALILFVEGNLDRHYCCAVFLSELAYLGGREPRPYLALLLFEQGLRLAIDKRKPGGTFNPCEGSFRHLLAIGYMPAGLVRLAVQHKRELEEWISSREVYEPFPCLPAVSEADKEVYDKIPVPSQRDDQPTRPGSPLPDNRCDCATWGREVAVAGAQGGPATEQEFRPGQTVVVIRPTALKIESQELARLAGGTEAKVLQVQEVWLWCEIAPYEDSVQLLDAGFEVLEARSKKEQPEGTRHDIWVLGWPLRGWVPRSAVRPGFEGWRWWIHALRPELKDLLRCRAQEALKHVSPHVQIAALDILARSAGRESIPALREALKDEDFTVRRAATDALGKLGQPAIPALREALKHEDWGVRHVAAEALGKLGDQESIPALREALKDEESLIRYVAAEALGKLGDQESIPALREALKDEDWGVRYAAADALGKLGGRQSIPALREALKDEEWVVCRAAAEALGKLGEPAIPALREALKDEEPGVRYAATRTGGFAMRRLMP